MKIVRIQTQAVITMANLALQMDESQDCISILKDWNAFDLGPGWDTSLIELHVAALLLEDKKMKLSHCMNN